MPARICKRLVRRRVYDVHHARQSVRQARQQSHQLALRVRSVQTRLLRIKSKSATS